MSEETLQRQVLKYSFFQLMPEWRRLPRAERKTHAEEFAGAVNDIRRQVLLRSYSLVGTRGDADFLLWMVHEDANRVHQAQARLNRTALAGYLTSPYSYFAVTKRSMYVDAHEHPGSESSRTRITPRDSPYLILYPFVKTREWYGLSREDRQKAMTQHMEFGHRYPNISINTGYSFGVDDQEFLVAFESDNIQDFVDMVQEMRHTRASAYTLRDTPAFTCLFKPIEEILEALG